MQTYYWSWLADNRKPRDYLNDTIFPILTPAINQMLRTAKVTEVF